MMRTLIFGSKGQLGRDLQQVFSRRGETIGYDLPELDVSNNALVRAVVTDFQPDAIINAAAYTQVDHAEDDREGAFRANEEGARVVAAAAAAQECPVVYYSTDYVFDGTATTPYEPDTPECPLGVYGASKAAGEAATRAETAGKHIILRTAWLYGPGGSNFVEKILSAAHARPELKVVDDEMGSPTHTLDLAWATEAALAEKAYGTHHAVNSGWCTRFAFAKAIIEMAGLDTRVTPCKSTEFETKAERPAYSVLSTRTLEEATGHKMRAWQDALRDYMERRSTHS